MEWAFGQGTRVGTLGTMTKLIKLPPWTPHREWTAWMSEPGWLPQIRAALHLEAGPICCVRGFKSSLVIGQKVDINPNPFTPTCWADLEVWFFWFKNCILWHGLSSLNWVHPKWRANSWPRDQCHISLKKNLLKWSMIFNELDPLDYAIFNESAKLLRPKAFTYGKIDPFYNLFIMCRWGRPPTQKRFKFHAIGLNGNWPGL
jgi:hypothetical protein